MRKKIFLITTIFALGVVVWATNNPFNSPAYAIFCDAPWTYYCDPFHNCTGGAPDCVWAYQDCPWGREFRRIENCSCNCSGSSCTIPWDYYYCDPYSGDLWKRATCADGKYRFEKVKDCPYGCTGGEGGSCLALTPTGSISCTPSKVDYAPGQCSKPGDVTVSWSTSNASNVWVVVNGTDMANNASGSTSNFTWICPSSPPPNTYEFVLYANYHSTRLASCKVYAYYTPGTSCPGDTYSCTENQTCNRPPTCSQISGPSNVYVESENPYVASASDPEGDSLSYSWSATNGNFIGSTNNYSVTWKAPSSQTTSVLSASVSDGRGGTASCPNKNVVVEWLPGWFQTQEGDVHAQSFSVSVSDGDYFSKKGSGGTPGVVSHESGTPDFSPGSVSETDWLAKTNFSKKGYNYFYQLLDSPTTDNFNNLSDISSNVVVYYSADNVDISAGFPGGRKAVVLVNGNVDIKTNIDDVPVGSFLAIIASGKINIANSVSRVEGIFMADGAFDTGTAATALTAEGTFIANSFDLDGRDLGAANKTTPAIKFIYRPDFWLNTPTELLVPSYTWEELAP